MDLPGDVPVTLVIKAPNQRMADQTVDCMLGWTIKKLKQHLETVYPSKPKHNEQRLIYSGRLLQDHLTLKEILRQYDDAEFTNKHTVHLVCSIGSDSPASSSSSSSASAKSARRSTPATTSAPTGQSSTEGTNSHMSSQNDGLRYRGQSPPASTTATTLPGTTSSSYYYPTTGAGGENPPTAYPGYPYTPEQYAWMMQQQQFYSQYMMQYMQYYQNLYYPGQPFNPQMPPSPFLQQPAAGASLPQQQQQQQQQPAQGQAGAAGNNAGAAGPARQNVRMNAQGGMEEDDEDDGEPRDWLHHTYFLMRFLTFMGILFFYSNLTRFLIVFAGSFAVYLLQRFRKYMQRVQREQEQQQQQQQQQQNQAAPPGQNEQQQQQEPQQQPQDSERQTRPAAENNTEGNPEAEDDSAAGQPEQQEPDAGRLARAFIFLWNTIQVFFTSLLPTPPELLDGN